MNAFVLVDGKIEETSSLDEIRAALKKGRKMWLDLDRQKEGIDGFLPLVDRIGARIEQLEEEVFRKAGKPEGALLGESIFAVKRSIQRMSRITTHQRSILEQLAGGEFASIPRDAVPYFRDVAAHL